MICNFRSSVCQALVLEIGETVQILEKSDGKTLFFLVIHINNSLVFDCVAIAAQRFEDRR